MRSFSLVVAGTLALGTSIASAQLSPEDLEDALAKERAYYQRLLKGLTSLEFIPVIPRGQAFDSIEAMTGGKFKETELVSFVDRELRTYRLPLRPTRPPTSSVSYEPGIGYLIFTSLVTRIETDGVLTGFSAKFSLELYELVALKRNPKIDFSTKIWERTMEIPEKASGYQLLEAASGLVKEFAVIYLAANKQQ